jgi:hypothetical protein
MADPTLDLVPGRQVWLVGRTDRDGASLAEVSRMVAGFLQYSFRDVSGGPPGSGANEVFSTEKKNAPLEWRVSSARPVRLLVPPTQSLVELESSMTAALGTASPAGGEGHVIARREDLDPLPLLVASTPWYIALEVWWRGPASTIPWPCLQVTWAGTRQRDYTEADWLLLRAFVPPGTATDPGGETWGEAESANVAATVDEVKKQLTAGLGTVAVLAVVIGGIVLASRRRR